MRTTKNGAPSGRNVYIRIYRKKNNAELEQKLKILKLRDNIMAKTYTQLYIHIVFSVKSWAKLISKDFQEELHKYITGIIQNKDQKLLAINSMPDHIHIFIGLKPNFTISDLVRDVKSNSTKFINENKWLKKEFHWQEGFAAFSHSHSQLNNVINYIQHQKNHHIKRSFREEYLEFLKHFGVDYDPRYIFD